MPRAGNFNAATQRQMRSIAATPSASSTLEQNKAAVELERFKGGRARDRH